MTQLPLRIGIVGCGVIAEPYARDLVKYPQLELAGCADIVPARAEALAAKYGIRAYPSVEALLADPSIALVINLTVHHVHYAVTAQCLEAGKHVHSEKPLALTVDEAQRLVALAREKNLRLGCSPFTWMFEAPQTAWKVIREGRLGTVRVIYAEVNWGRIETWHPEPGPFYEVGALFDVGVYPLHILTSLFGPAKRVSALASVLWPDRVTKRGVPFHVETPDFVVSLIELASGPLIRLTTNFYVTQSGKQGGIEFHGDLGSLSLASWHMPNAAVEFELFNEPYQPVPYVREPQTDVRWGWAVADMAEAIATGRPHRATGEQAAHVVEILCAATEAYRTGRAVEVHSTFTPPAPMEWAV